MHSRSTRVTTARVQFFMLFEQRAFHPTLDNLIEPRTSSHEHGNSNPSSTEPVELNKARLHILAESKILLEKALRDLEELRAEL